jgi:alginate O-acetyltransferase complex protein AlgJ
VVPERVDGALGEFYGALRAKGVRVVDLTEVFLAARGKGGEPYCRQDSHWSGVGCELAAGQLAEMIRKDGWYGAVVRGEFQSKETTVTLSGDLREALAEGERPERESVRLRVVSGKDGSPVVLMGDSHNLVFHAGADMHATGAGLPDQLALELGFAVDLVAVRGSGATPARINLYRNGRADAGYLKGKKLVIWCFAAREFTESQGWRLVPVSK